MTFQADYTTLMQQTSVVPLQEIITRKQCYRRENRAMPL